MSVHGRDGTTTADPHSQAALMLCESLLHLLVEKGVLDSEEVADTVEEIIDLQREMTAREDNTAASRTAIGLLSTLVITFRAK